MLLPLFVFIVSAAGVFGLYALVMYLPGHMARRDLDKRLRDVSMPFDPVRPRTVTVGAYGSW